jgi:hypothetical protein
MLMLPNLASRQPVRVVIQYMKFIDVSEGYIASISRSKNKTGN